MNKLLIFDLDDTIFETKKIKKESVKPILEKFKSIAIKRYGQRLTNQIIAEFWKYPFDFIAEKYNFSNLIKLEFEKTIHVTNFKFDIQPFEDFKLFKNMTVEKILVTTGFIKLQQIKIKTLGIKNDFSDIYIDDVLDPNRIFKKGIFKKILRDKKVEYNNVLIIGDNPQSELKAGYELGLKTIQVSKFGQKKSKFSNFIISDFKELIEIIS